MSDFLTALSSWQPQDEFIFAPSLEGGDDLLTDTKARLFAQQWTVSTDIEDDFASTEVDGKIEFKHAFDSTKILVLGVSGPVQSRELNALYQPSSEAWMPFEWIETTTNGAPLQITHCKLTHAYQAGRESAQAKRHIFQILLRDVQDSITSTIIISSEILDMSVRGVYLIQIPADLEPAKADEVQAKISIIKDRFKFSSQECPKFPLLLPLYFLEIKLQDLEQSCAFGLPNQASPGSAYMEAIIKHANGNHADTAKTLQSLYTTCAEFHGKPRQLSDIYSILRGIIEGNELLGAEVWTEEITNAIKFMKARLEFLKVRVEAIERGLDGVAEEFKALDSMALLSISLNNGTTRQHL